jgi:hypothetical protein
MSGFKAFLDRLRLVRLPAYGTLHWDGQAGQVVTAVNFELHRQESVETVCGRAYRYFAQLSEAEATAVDIELTIRDGKPVRGVLKPRPDAPAIIGTARLRELAGVLKSP